MLYEGSATDVSVLLSFEYFAVFKILVIIPYAVKKPVQSLDTPFDCDEVRE